MLKILQRVSVFVLIGVIAEGAAFAKTIKKGITFAQPVVVNGAVVKKGSYDAVFDDQTNELTIVKDRKVVARAPAQLETTQERDHGVYLTREEGNSSTLLSVTFKGGKQATLINNSEGNSAQ